MDSWLSLSSLTAFLLGGALVFLGMVGGGYARRRGAGDPRPGAGSDATVQDASTRPNRVADHEEAAARRADEMSLHEWDGGPPRPNWNRQRNLNVLR